MSALQLDGLYTGKGMPANASPLRPLDMALMHALLQSTAA